jgi:hypothetical protein
VCHRVHLGVYLKAYLRVCLTAFCELTWKCIVKQAGSVFESMLGSVLESVLRAIFGAYSQAGWECHRVQLGVERVLGSVLESVLRANLEAYSQVDWECAIECNWECI